MAPLHWNAVQALSLNVFIYGEMYFASAAMGIGGILFPEQAYKMFFPSKVHPGPHAIFFVQLSGLLMAALGITMGRYLLENYESPDRVVSALKLLMVGDAVHAYLVLSNLQTAFKGWSRGAIMNLAVTGALFALRVNFLMGLI